MNLQAKTAVISLFVTLGILFGGLLGYQYWFVQKPLEHAVRSTPHVQIKQLTIQHDRVKLVLATDREFSLASHYGELLEEIAPIVGKRQLELELLDHPGEELEAAWNEMAFGVREGIDIQRYSQIPQSVAQVAKARNIQYRTKMDDRFVYIELRQKDRYMYQVLPLHKTDGEVKNNG
ncbi:hypothetical protein [Lihuaxuella thermophila]|uniref:Uncharacterized protein n=1 Tax=Lihuaxuella thermophila TaxID=1173111 RepID=A0A1H8FDN2_9BACL|nr:hypothetical protein [Lihuaxuella thermophila]SEN29680.1 hypothetical protein SAMN05444955_108141 [Lihuaxuella thermophila]